MERKNEERYTEEERHRLQVGERKRRACLPREQ